MQYLLMIYRSEAELFKMTDSDRQKMSADYGTYTQSIIQSGHFKAGDGLQPSTTATTVRVRDGKVMTTDGPFAEIRGQEVKLAPSILAANFACLGAQVADAEKAGADRIHIDVMDGHFVPNLSMGAPVVASLRPVTSLQLETHLMISNPDLFLDEFAESGSDSFLVHWEGNVNLHRTVQRIRAIGKRAGVAINPATPASVLEEILPDVDQVLVMTVDPGFGHQHFLHSTLDKISRVRQMIDRIKPECDLEVDGGIDSETARLCVDMGATVLVAGSSVFGTKESVPEAMSRLRAGGK